MNEYTLIDCNTELIYGPYESCGIARTHAYDLNLKRWEILNQDGNVVEWGRDDNSSYILCMIERHVWAYLTESWRQCRTCSKVQARKPRSDEWYDVIANNDAEKSK
jgi:hypothetical protein